MMRWSSWRLLLRCLIILRVCRHWRLDEDWRHPDLRGLRVLAGVLFFWQRRCANNLERGARLRAALVELGPIFVKFGQMLSTRRDLLPADIADALSALQDRVPPFSGALASATVAAAWGGAISEKLAEFDEQPLASASVAQVHAARLPDGLEVVVKIIRPGIRAQIDQDLALLNFVARLLERHHPDGRRLRARAVIRDYATTLLNELDLRLEAANTAALQRNFQDGKTLYVPTVHFDLVRENVMVMERIYGIPIGDVAALKAAGVNMKVLAERGVSIFFTQVFRDRFFHADMHPGNIFVDVSDPELPRYIGIDCAIMGTLDEHDQRYLADNFLAFFNRDYRRVAELHWQSGWIPPDVRVEDFEAAIRAHCEPMFGKPLAEISFGTFLLGLFQTARRFRMSVQPQLVLLQKTLFYVEGLGRQLYPELDLWQTAKPFLEAYTRERHSPRRLWQRWRAQWPRLLQELPDLPDNLAAVLGQHRLREQDLRAQNEWRSRWLAESRLRRRQTRRYLGISFIFAGLVLSGTLALVPGTLSLLVIGLGVLLMLRA